MSSTQLNINHTIFGHCRVLVTLTLNSSEENCNDFHSCFFDSNKKKSRIHTSKKLHLSISSTNDTLHWMLLMCFRRRIGRQLKIGLLLLLKRTQKLRSVTYILPTRNSQFADFSMTQDNFRVMSGNCLGLICL